MVRTREIARLAGAEYRSVSQELERLESLGLLGSGREGRRRLWQLKEGPLRESLARLLDEARKHDMAQEAAIGRREPSIPDCLKPILRDLRLRLSELYGDRLFGLWLYGSRSFPCTSQTLNGQAAPFGVRFVGWPGRMNEAGLPREWGKLLRKAQRYLRSADLLLTDDDLASAVSSTTGLDFPEAAARGVCT